jgi:hypothetical protein
MIAFAPFIVVSDLPNARTPIEERIFQAVDRRRNWRRKPPQHHLDDRAVFVVDALVEEQFRLCHGKLMVLLAIWCQEPYLSRGGSSGIAIVRDERPRTARGDTGEIGFTVELQFYSEDAKVTVRRACRIIRALTL